MPITPKFFSKTSLKQEHSFIDNMTIKVRGLTLTYDI